VILTLALAVSIIGQHTAPGSIEGMSLSKLDLIDTRIRQRIIGGEMAGVVTMICRNGRVIRHEAYGWSHLESKRLMRENDLFQAWSMTKPPF
jgi:CubicO group peptidase (beta-lactamase class C family)